MLAALVVLLTLMETPFGSSVDRALGFAQNRDWVNAAAVLDRAWMDDPAAFEANNLHYLRGRIAKEQRDWGRALEEFTHIDPANPLRPLAVWHAADASIKLDLNDRAEQLIGELPPDFPADLRIQLLRSATPELALKIVEGMTTREARLQRAFLLEDMAGLWILLRERNSDDVALAAGQRLMADATNSVQRKDLGATFLAHRQFAHASAIYVLLAQDPAYSAEAQYQLARMRFLSQDYPAAIDGYRAVAAAFPGTSWARDSEYQIANSLWRLRQYEEAAKAYQQLIDRSKGGNTPENAIRDLADIYRSLGQSDKAISLIDRTLTRRLSAATKQVLLFTKMKILYSQQKYSRALQVIRQLKGSRFQTTAGGTSSDEIVYFEALSLAKTGSAAAAKAAWKRLAANPGSYYGQRAAFQLGAAALPNSGPPASAVCDGTSDLAREAAIGRLSGRRRPILAVGDRSDVVAELLFMQLWDEASLWIERTRRPDASLAADLGYAGGRYDRAIAHADRLPRSTPGVLASLYPAGFRTAICRASAQYGVDPLWLHAIIWQESKYNAAAHSAASARGLMQFIPETAEAIAPAAGVIDLTLDKLYDPETSIQLGAYYWASLLSEFKSPELALAAYNGGPDNVRRWQDKWPGSDGEFFISDIGFTETKRYVQAVFTARAAYGRAN
jgi:soluble lytic murein transglycosylase